MRLRMPPNSGFQAKAPRPCKRKSASSGSTCTWFSSCLKCVMRSCFAWFHCVLKLCGLVFHIWAVSSECLRMPPNSWVPCSAILVFLHVLLELHRFRYVFDIFVQKLSEITVLRRFRFKIHETRANAELQTQVFTLAWSAIRRRRAWATPPKYKLR